MSGCSGSGICPKCGGSNLMTYSDYKSFDCVSGECLDCGFNYCTLEEKRISLKQLNERRKDYDMKPLKKLAKQRGA